MNDPALQERQHLARQPDSTNIADLRQCAPKRKLVLWGCLRPVKRYGWAASQGASEWALSRRYAIALAAGFALALSATASMAATVVDVQLWDKGAGATMATNLAYGTPGLDMSKATMGIKTSRASVPTGVVSFQVRNTSKDTVHEMIVMYMDDPSKPLPYVDKDNKVDEDKAGDKGEVSELDPGKFGELTVALKPGKYLLICNVAGHFAAGMWTEVDVTK